MQPNLDHETPVEPIEICYTDLDARERREFDLAEMPLPMENEQ